MKIRLCSLRQSVTLSDSAHYFIDRFLLQPSFFKTEWKDSMGALSKGQPFLLYKNQRLLLLSLTFEVYFSIFALFWPFWAYNTPISFTISFPIALKNCVLSAFRQNNAPQLRLYQNWGANMANTNSISFWWKNCLIAFRQSRRLTADRLSPFKVSLLWSVVVKPFCNILT